ncbi:L-lactate dehydrogenase [Moryella indoligenes]|uniref:L-lactate dehydrogenase n=1 Tax=Moryella indoligenes TaxID=371674 RepID=A0AAE3V8W7_9FIRM|nr:L-lactate dehydrogenase [Moryella indoligenes]MDQ0151653.1 L-lactate dehydrogenase [Moryella indoligenes]
MMNKKRVVGIIGVGHVGAHCAYSLAVQGIADEIILIDKNHDKAVSECQDLFDSVAYLPHRIAVRVGDFSDAGDCDVLVNSVGDINLLRGTHDRLTEMDFTIPAVDGYVKKIMDSGFDGIIINITNPCDIVTQEIAQLSGLPRGRVFGTGTGLDSSRLRSALARQTGIDHKSICAYMMGEHGAAQMVPWSAVTFGGQSLTEWAGEDERFRFDHEAMKKEVIGAGWVTFSGKFCTEYGISSTLARLVHIVFTNEKQILPVSTELQGEYGQDKLFVGVPAVIGANGVEEVVEIPMTPEERAEFAQCCDSVRHNMEHLKDLR